MDKLIIVIRSVGERSASYCYDTLKGTFINNQVYLLEERPFSKAIRKSFHLGIQSDAEWMLCIDADVLVSKNGVLDLYQRALATDQNVFQIQGIILDKLIPIFRPAGNHLYRTAYMKKALDLIPAEGESLRPETSMLNAMRDIGYPWQQCDSVVGIHDYEQLYEDIFRKTFLQSHKHERVISLVEPYWRERAVQDEDFQAALLGLRAGEKYQGTVLVNKSFLLNEAREVLRSHSFKEKPPLISSSVDVNKVIEEYRAESKGKFELIQTTLFPYKSWNKLRSKKKKRKKRIYKKWLSKLKQMLSS